MIRTVATRTIPEPTMASMLRRSPSSSAAKSTPKIGTKYSETEATVTSRCSNAAKKHSIDAPYIRIARNANAAHDFQSKAANTLQWKGSAQISNGDRKSVVEGKRVD